MQPLPGEHPPQVKITHLERPGADAAAVVPPQHLLVPHCSERGLAAVFLPQHEVHPPRGILACLVKRQDPCGAIPDLVWDNRFGSVDEEGWSFAH